MLKFLFVLSMALSDKCFSAVLVILLGHDALFRSSLLILYLISLSDMGSIFLSSVLSSISIVAVTSSFDLDRSSRKVNCVFSVSAKTSAFSHGPYTSPCCPTIDDLKVFYL